MDLMTDREFLDLLGRKGGDLSHEQITVEGYVHIDGKSLGLDSVHLKNIMFVHSLEITNFESEEGYLTLENCNIREGLRFNKNSCRRIAAVSTKISDMSSFRNRFKKAFFADFFARGSLDLSGFELDEELTILNTQFEKLELLHQSSRDIVRTLQVETDDPIIAMQFRLASIPVFMSTENVRKNLLRLTMV